VLCADEKSQIQAIDPYPTDAACGPLSRLPSPAINKPRRFRELARPAFLAVVN
jgi:hypothetical protein